jgi:ParB-like chromosome segregation protein Spo0J
LPTDLAEMVTDGRLTPTAALTAWQKRVVENPEDETAAANNSHELRRLADSIALHGLINPISVRRPNSDETIPAGVKYFVVTGERRYWSHVLLHTEGRQIHEGEQTQDAALIKATLTAKGVRIRSHQLIENIMREDINAVEKGWGLWALRYELSGVTHGLPHDDDVRLVPWSQVEETLNISKQHRIRLISVLDLSEEAQRLMAQHNLAERAVRPIVQKLKEHPALQIAALRQLVAWQRDEKGPGEAMSKAVQSLVDRLLSQSEMTEPASSSGVPDEAIYANQQIKQIQKRLQGTTRFLDRLEQDELRRTAAQLSAADIAETLADLHHLRTKIDTMLVIISQDDVV